MKVLYTTVPLAIISAALLLTGCGIPQEDYDNLLNEKTQLETDYQTLENDKASLESDKSSLEDDIATLQGDFDELQSDYDKLTDEKESLDEECQSLTATKNRISSELTELKSKYPLKEFSSLTELEEWLKANVVSEKPYTLYAEDWYVRALEVQIDAMEDGYLVSADYDYDSSDDSYSVFCTTIIDGRVFYWDPENDEVYEDIYFGTIK